MSTCLRVPARLAAILSFAVLSSLGLLAAAPASGAPSQRASARHAGIVHSRCALKGRKKSPNRRGAPAGCSSVSRRAVAPHAGAPAGGGVSAITATQLEGAAGSAQQAVTTTSQPPASESSAPAPAPAPAGAGSPPSVSSAGSEAGWNVLSDPIDPTNLLRVPFGKTSFWLQPWRAYFDTWPSSQLTNAVGINFNVNYQYAEAAARVLHDSGFKLARVEIGFGTLSYENPHEFRSGAPALHARLVALHNNGLRPLIVLNANAGDPAPSKVVWLTTTTEAPAGASTVQLSAASAAEVVPGKTGFDYISWNGAPDVLITAVDGNGVATLSTPLKNALAAGKHMGTTLLYAPFVDPQLVNGQPTNPAFMPTWEGWLNYVATVCREVEAVVGPGGFDLEVWNELSFGSQFLNAEDYGPHPPAKSPEQRHKGEVLRHVINALLKGTVAYVRNPANGISPAVGITNGFASETPFPSGAYAPLGLTALSKHPYAGVRSFPEGYRRDFIKPVNALGQTDLVKDARAPFSPLFIPNYQVLQPEYMLTAVSTENLVRDIAPITTEVYGLPHGREVGPPGGQPLQKWITEYNIGAPEGATGLTFADRAHFHAKALLRNLVASVNKGISRAYYFGTGAGPFSVIGQEFWSALEAHPETYPGDALAGEILSGFHNMLERFQGPGPGGSAHHLSLLSVAQYGNHAQFLGDGTAAHPSLYDRDVLAVLPFQNSPNEFVIPVYVMTSDVLTLYEPGQPSSDIRRYDLPDEAFRITLGNLPESSTAPSVSAYDPLRNESTPARLVSREGSSATFEVAATDYPRLLRVAYSA